MLQIVFVSGNGQPWANIQMDSCRFWAVCGGLCSSHSCLVQRDDGPVLLPCSSSRIPSVHFCASKSSTCHQSSHPIFFGKTTKESGPSSTVLIPGADGKVGWASKAWVSRGHCWQQQPDNLGPGGTWPHWTRPGHQAELQPDRDGADKHSGDWANYRGRLWHIWLQSEQWSWGYICKYQPEARRWVGHLFFKHIILHSGSNFDKNKILYIMLGVFALATLILLAILCIILYKVNFLKRVRSLDFHSYIYMKTFCRGEKDPTWSTWERWSKKNCECNIFLDRWKQTFVYI